MKLFRCNYAAEYFKPPFLILLLIHVISLQIIVSGNEGVAVPTDFDEKAVYVIDGPDGISQVVASAEEFQVTFYLLGEECKKV